MSESPSAWRKYVVLTNEGVPPAAAQFRARYRMAKTYSGSTFVGISRELQTVYSELIRAGFIYSAVEAFGNMHFGEGWESEITFISRERATELRTPRFGAMHLMLDRNLEHSSRKRHYRFYSGESDNLLLLLGPLRHLIFHGPATAYGSGLVEDQIALNIFHETLTWTLQQIDDLFTKHVEDLSWQGTTDWLTR